MKGKRLVATMLALLLVVSLLPMTAMADYIVIQPGDTVEEIRPEDTTGSNPGTVNNNHGKVLTNTATIVNNGTAGGGRGSGHVSTNSGLIENNYGYVGNSYGTINHNQSGGYVSSNNSSGTVETNAENATIERNVGTVGKKDESWNVIEGSGNSGTIKENYGTVFTNNATGTVETNDKRGTIETNNGTVGEEGNNASGNYGTIHINKSGGNVLINQSSGVVDVNLKGGTIETNKGIVGCWRDDVSMFEATSGNKGTVGDNTSTGKVNNLAGGKVVDNSGTVSNDEGSTVVNNNAGGTVENKGGKVVNNYGATGENPNAGGTVNNYGGTVVSNSGIVCNNTDGSVVKVNEVDGIVSNNSNGPDDAGPKVEINFGTVNYPAHLTYYGVHYEDESKNRVYIDQFERNTEVSISDLKISRPGYKLVNCQAVEKYDRSEENRFADVTNYENITTKNDDGSVRSFIIQAPIRLKLLWEKIVTAVEPASSGGEVVSASYNPKYIGLGSVIFINEKGYKVVEIKDDAYVVVTFDALPDEDVQDLDALYAKLFTAEQQKLIKNLGQLLDAEDVLTIFGKPGNHPVYEINKSLVE